MGTRTLFVEGGDYEGGIGKESVCEVLELAEENLGCTGVVVCLRKNVVDLGKLSCSLTFREKLSSASLPSIYN